MSEPRFFVGSLVSEWAEKAQIECLYFSSVGSTNDEAKKEAFAKPANIHLFVTDEQTQGRGRGTNTWSGGAPGENLAMTFSYRLPAAPQPPLSALLGLAVYRALLASFPGLDWSLKAPNDIFLNGLKVAGCLTEVVTRSSADYRLVFGLGLNIFSSPTESPATHLATHFEHLEVQDFLGFLDRLLLEITMAVSKRSAKISKSEQAILVFALNKNPHLPDRLKSVSEDGDLIFEKRTQKWSDL